MPGVSTSWLLESRGTKNVFIVFVFFAASFSSCKKHGSPILTGPPDLTPKLYMSSNQVAAGGTIQEVIQIKNQGRTATTNPISFSISTYTTGSALSVASNNSASVTIGSTTYPLSNAADWDFNTVTGNFTSKSGVIIPAGGIKNVGVIISRGAPPNHGANGSASHTVVISPGTGGGETPTSNNSVDTIVIKN